MKVILKKTRHLCQQGLGVCGQEWAKYGQRSLRMPPKSKSQGTANQERNINLNSPLN